MRHAILSLALVLAIVVSGCAGIPDAGNPDTSGTVTTPNETTTQAKETAGEKTPEKGSNLLSISQINESTAMKYNASARADFKDLNDTQQQAFERALKCDCNVNQEVFRFNDKDRIEVVKYEGDYYYLRVTIV